MKKRKSLWFSRLSGNLVPLVPTHHILSWFPSAHPSIHSGLVTAQSLGPPSSQTAACAHLLTLTLTLSQLQGRTRDEEGPPGETVSLAAERDIITTALWYRLHPECITRPLIMRSQTYRLCLHWEQYEEEY